MLAIPPNLYMIVYGLLLVAIILAMPRGIAGGIDRGAFASRLRWLGARAGGSGRRMGAALASPGGGTASIPLERPPEEVL